MGKLLAAIFALAALAMPPAAGPARADDAERVPPVTDPVVRAECGDCHMAFQPGLLPRESWARIMDTLQDHFGEDAGLEPAAERLIRDYYLRHSGSTRGSRRAQGRARRADAALPRITETRWWRREHDAREVPPGVWRRQAVGSKANCVACHRGAERGNYDDDGIRVPAATAAASSPASPAGDLAPRRGRSVTGRLWNYLGFGGGGDEADDDDEDDRREGHEDDD